jgi:hypothetical protein
MKERGYWPIDLFRKNEKKLLQLAYCCRWEKRGGRKIMWVACSCRSWLEKAAGCGRGAEEENSWLMQLA